MRSAARALFAVGLVATGLLSVSPSAWLVQNGLDIPSISLAADQWLSAAKHVSVYAVLAFVGVFGFSAPRAWVWLGIGLFLYGLGLEAAQTLVADRTGDVLDGLANGIGIGIGLWAERWMTDRRAATQ